jgi:diguanylate cyclase (GGDEF)-like protein|tara:strand:- start:46690 stop:48570 length:1881 start_codon:yes stop_codon:yes gene_type:complete
MLLIDLIYNISLLVFLIVFYQVVVSRNKREHVLRKVILGLLLGLVALVGMLAPMVYSEGIFFDGRSIVLFVAGLFGGPVSAGVAALMVGAYRVWQGGVGMSVGVATIVMAAGVGVAFYYFRRRHGGLTAIQAFGAGLVVHLLMLLLFLLLPNGIGFAIVREIWLTVLLAYPAGTVAVCLLFQDYEDQEASRDNLRWLAYYDALTALPNRHQLTEQVAKALSLCISTGEKGAVLLIHLDRFSRLNDARGYDVGDRLLQEVARRLQGTLGEKGMLARMSGGDFFVLLHDHFPSDSTLEQVVSGWVTEITTMLKTPVELDDLKIPVFVSVGVTFFPHDRLDTPVQVLKRADVAMHRAKWKGGNQSIFYEQSMSVVAEQQFQIERELRVAIAENQLQLYFQSQIDTNNNVVGAETFVRWLHPERGLISPGVFIPIAEETDLIVELGEWVLQKVCQTLANDTLGLIPGRMAVNISPRHFMHPGFLDSVQHIVQTTGVNPERLTFEVTETLWIHDLFDVVEKMRILTKTGIHFSLDDFGTGYSSLTYIKHLPIHELKIDKTFVQDAPKSKDSAALVESILAVARHMNLQVVAEGVETREQADFLSARGYVVYQGYFFCRPEPFDQWIKRITE